jgi:hypothetical protein
MPSARTGTARKLAAGGAVNVNGRAARPGEDHGGASAADEKYDLSRHWRNSRTHASRDPASWKYHHIGNYMLNDVVPPNHGQL